MAQTWNMRGTTKTPERPQVGTQGPFRGSERLLDRNSSVGRSAVAVGRGGGGGGEGGERGGEGREGGRGGEGEGGGGGGGGGGGHRGRWAGRCSMVSQMSGLAWDVRLAGGAGGGGGGEREGGGGRGEGGGGGGGGPERGGRVHDPIAPGEQPILDPFERGGGGGGGSGVMPYSATESELMVDTRPRWSANVPSSNPGSCSAASRSNSGSLKRSDRRIESTSRKSRAAARL